MDRSTACRDCGKTLLFFYADEFITQAPFELVERGFGVFGRETLRRVSRTVPDDEKDLILHDCEESNG